MDFTIVLPRKPGKVLLGIKTRKIGKGRWNGYGGKIELGQTPPENGANELRQESSLICNPRHLIKTGIIHFINTDEAGNEIPSKAHVFNLYEWEGEPKDSEEMVNHTWFDNHRLPFDQMLAADRFWLPEVLNDRIIYAWAKYAPDQRELIGEVIVTNLGACPK